MGWSVVRFKPHFFLHSQLFFLCGFYLSMWIKRCLVYGKWFLAEMQSFCLALVYRTKKV